MFPATIIGGVDQLADWRMAGKTRLIAAALQQLTRSATDQAPDSPTAAPRPLKSNSAASR
jgi:hypothetical protein